MKSVEQKKFEAEKAKSGVKRSVRLEVYAKGSENVERIHWDINTIWTDAIIFQCAKCGEPYTIERHEYGWQYGDKIPFRHCHNCGGKAEYISFMEAVLNYHSDPGMIHAYIEYWHEHETMRTLPDFLGMTADEYARWLKDGSCLEEILEERRQKANA